MSRVSLFWFCLAGVPLVWLIYRVIINRHVWRSDWTPANQNYIKSKNIYHWEPLGDYAFQVVGESFCQPAIQKVASQCGENELSKVKLLAYLVPDDKNKHDKLAVRVDIMGLTVGHLSREDARSFRRRLTSKKMSKAVTTCDAKITGGFRKRNGEIANFGVQLDIKPFE